MKKTLAFAGTSALALLLASSARAVNVVSLPGLPSMPLNTPSAIPSHQPLSLPTVGAPGAVVLPGVATNLPKIAPALPTLPMPVIGRPNIALPSPARPLPIAPVAVVAIPKSAAALARFDAPKSAPAVHEDQTRREDLERLFDNTQDERYSGRDEVRHTLPETDLLTEIGIQ